MQESDYREIKEKKMFWFILCVLHYMRDYVYYAYICINTMGIIYVSPVYGRG